METDSDIFIKRWTSYLKDLFNTIDEDNKIPDHSNPDFDPGHHTCECSECQDQDE